MKIIVNLIRERISENEVWVDSFECDESVINPEQSMRAAVKEYLKTEEGKKAIKDTCNDFNWGDAVLYVPDKIWNKYGLYPLNRNKSIDIKVNQDEILFEDENSIS